MLSAGLSAQSARRPAAPGRCCARLQLQRAFSHQLNRTERRRVAQRGGRLAARAAAAPDPPASGGSGGDSDAAAMAAVAAGQPTQPSSRPPPPASLIVRTVAQVLALAAALACLTLLPAFVSGRLAQQPLQAAASYSLYLLFFASGTISRMLRHGRLADAQQDAQRSSGGARLALLLFAAVVVPTGHWAAWWDPSLAHLAATAPRAAASAAQLLPLAGYSLMLGGWALNAAAAAALGKVGASRLAGGAQPLPCHRRPHARLLWHCSAGLTKAFCPASLLVPLPAGLQPSGGT